MTNPVPQEVWRKNPALWTFPLISSQKRKRSQKLKTNQRNPVLSSQKRKRGKKAKMINQRNPVPQKIWRKNAVLWTFPVTSSQKWKRANPAKMTSQRNSVFQAKEAEKANWYPGFLQSHLWQICRAQRSKKQPLKQNWKSPEASQRIPAPICLHPSNLRWKRKNDSSDYQ